MDSFTASGPPEAVLYNTYAILQVLAPLTPGSVAINLPDMASTSYGAALLLGCVVALFGVPLFPKTIALGELTMDGNLLPTPGAKDVISAIGSVAEFTRDGGIDCLLVSTLTHNEVKEIARGVVKVIPVDDVVGLLEQGICWGREDKNKELKEKVWLAPIIVRLQVIPSK